MAEFFADLRSALGLRALKRTGQQVLDNDCLPLAGQLAYFFVLFLFPFLMLLVALMSALVDHPDRALRSLTESLNSFAPAELTRLLLDYIDRTLRSTSAITLFFAALLTLGAGSTASEAIIKAANRSYQVEETRPFWKIRGLSILLIVGFTILVAMLVLVVFSSTSGVYLQQKLGLPESFMNFWRLLGWVIAFIVLTLALDVLYYVAPNAEVPFRWITPGGLVASILLIVASEVLRFWVANIFRYNQLYGQLGVSIVLLIWLYATGLMVLVGVEINAVLARIVEERKDREIIYSEGARDDMDS